MYQTLYYTYDQGSLLLGVTLFGALDKNGKDVASAHIDYPQPFVQSAVATCVIPMPDLVSYHQPSDPFCFSEYISQQENRFLFLANI